MMDVSIAATNEGIKVTGREIFSLKLKAEDERIANDVQLHSSTRMP